jgi:hypothetical protein
VWLRPCTVASTVDGHRQEDGENQGLRPEFKHPERGVQGLVLLLNGVYAHCCLLKDVARRTRGCDGMFTFLRMAYSQCKQGVVQLKPWPELFHGVRPQELRHQLETQEKQDSNISTWLEADIDSSIVHRRGIVQQRD